MLLREVPMTHDANHHGAVEAAAADRQTDTESGPGRLPTRINTSRVSCMAIRGGCTNTHNNCSSKAQSTAAHITCGTDENPTGKKEVQQQQRHHQPKQQQH